MQNIYEHFYGTDDEGSKYSGDYRKGDDNNNRIVDDVNSAAYNNNPNTLLIIECILLMGVFVIMGIILSSEKKGNLYFSLVVQRSTIEREMLPKEKCEFRDSDSEIGSHSESSESLSYEKWSYYYYSGLEYFYERTGVQPHLLIIDDSEYNNDLTAKYNFFFYPSVNSWNYNYPRASEKKEELDLKSYGIKRYTEEFGDDEGHLIIIARRSSEHSEMREFTLVAGKDAEAYIMDEQAQEILLDYIHAYYTSSSGSSSHSSKESDGLDLAFQEAADRIMTKQLPLAVVIVFFVVGIATVIALIVVVIRFYERKRKLREQRQIKFTAEERMTRIQQKQKDYDQKIKKEEVEVRCPNCDSVNSIRVGTTGFCHSCGGAILAPDFKPEVKINRVKRGRRFSDNNAAMNRPQENHKPVQRDKKFKTTTGLYKGDYDKDLDLDGDGFVSAAERRASSKKESDRSW